MKTSEKFRLDRAAFMTEIDCVTNLTALCGEVTTWTTADSAIAVVDESGVVTAIGDGDTVITATTADGRTAKCIVPQTRPPFGFDTILL